MAFLCDMSRFEVSFKASKAYSRTESAPSTLMNHLEIYVRSGNNIPILMSYTSVCPNLVHSELVNYTIFTQIMLEHSMNP